MPIESDAVGQHWPTLAIAAILFGLFVAGSHPASGHIFQPPWDKAAHFTVFGVLAVALRYRFRHWPHITILVVCLVIGAADELHQIFVPDRTPSFADGAADLLGAGIGLLFSRLMMSTTR
jgi:VanZ family protein